jgi:type IV secretory pathway TrbF-like protein
MVWLVSRSRCVPYVVEVDELGYALTQAQLLAAASMLDVVQRSERYELASFLRQGRSVSSDPHVGGGGEVYCDADEGSTVRRIGCDGR